MAKLSWSQFTGGLSVSPRLGQKGSYYKGDGVNIYVGTGVLNNGSSVTNYDGYVKTGTTPNYTQSCVFGDRYILSGIADGNNLHIRLDDFHEGGNSITDTVGGNYSEVNAIATQVDQGTPYVYYSYGSDVGRVSLVGWQNDDFDTNYPTWLSNTQSSGGISGGLLVSKDQKLYIQDDNYLDEYDGNDGSYTTQRLGIPEYIKHLNRSNQYIVIGSKWNLYFWDGGSDNYNYEINSRYPIRDVAIRDGQTYFLSYRNGHEASPEDQTEYTLYKANNDFGGHTAVSQFSIPDTSSGEQFLGFSKMCSDGHNLYWFGVRYNDSTKEEKYNIWRYGSKSGTSDALSIESQVVMSNVNTSSDTYQHIDELASHRLIDYSDRFYMFSTYDNENHLNYVEVLDTSSANADFETREIDLEQTNTNYNKGQLQSIAIFYKGSSASNTTVKALLNDGDQTVDLCNSASFPASDSMKVLSASKEEFTSMRVKIQGKLPGITKIEARYNPMEYYG